MCVCVRAFFFTPLISPLVSVWFGFEGLVGNYLRFGMHRFKGVPYVPLGEYVQPKSVWRYGLICHPDVVSYDNTRFFHSESTGYDLGCGREDA